MESTIVVLVLLLGFIIGLIVGWVLKSFRLKAGKEMADELLRKNEVQQQANLQAVVESLKSSFGALSLEALSKSTEEFLKLSNERLESQRQVHEKGMEAKKGLIDQQLHRMTGKMEEVSGLMRELEKDRVRKFGELSQQLKNTSEQTSALLQTTGMLREALANSRIRGQWGERMAEDVLQLAGMIENVNYLKQRKIEGVGTRPDFTFLLPKNLVMNMDVKFPLDNYVRFVESDAAPEKEKFRNDFLKDVKSRVREVTTREYINPEQNTVDYVLLFIPNEQIYAFIHEQDSSILDDAMRNRVIFCSPITLFAVLAVVRQAVENFALHETSNEILSLFGAFRKQWAEFLKRFEVLGKKISDTQKEYESILTTRRRQLERPLNKIERLRTERGLAVAQDEGHEEAQEEPKNDEGVKSYEDSVQGEGLRT